MRTRKNFMPHDIKAINSYSNNLGWIYLQYAHIAVVFACKKKIPMGKCDSYICIIFQAGEVHFKTFLQTDTPYNMKLKYTKKV